MKSRLDIVPFCLGMIVLLIMLQTVYTARTVSLPLKVVDKRLIAQEQVLQTHSEKLDSIMGLKFSPVIANKIRGKIDESK